MFKPDSSQLSIEKYIFDVLIFRMKNYIPHYLLWYNYNFVLFIVYLRDCICL